MKFIYESPDGGKTVYRTIIGSDKRELIIEDRKELVPIETIVTEWGTIIPIFNVSN